jgi:ubiquinone/menaquinone biosynthesis C-methylase UbiE
MRDYNKIDPEKYQKIYETIPRENYTKEHWRPLISNTIKKYCKDKNVLDLGCGYGRYMGVINKHTKSVIGVDISKRWLNYAKQKYPNIKFVLADASKIPLEDELFDVIVTIGLFEFINRNIVMREIYRVLKQGSFCVISVPNKYSALRLVGKLLNKLFGREIQTDEPSKEEMFKLFKDNKFELVEYKMDDGLIWLPNFLDRLCGKKIYLFIEKIFKIFGQNPFSNIMLFIIKKQRE